MHSISARSLAPRVNHWLATSQQPRVLHVFDRACSLINEHRDVLSVVTSQIREGPFNLVVDDDILFSEDLDIESPVSVSNQILRLGDLHIHLANATLWNPRPAWERLHARKNDIHQKLAQSEITNYLQTPGLYPPPGTPSQLYRLRLQSQSLLCHLTSALGAGNRVGAQEYASRLAGVGIGLTPSGDDVLMGGIYASWIIHPFAVASVLARDIASTAAALTASLSAEWLKAAGSGEAGVRWHEFFDALLAGENRQISRALEAIVQVGETSGADALAGFYGTLIASGHP